MRLIIQSDYQSVSKWAAHYVAAKIKPLIRHLKNRLYWDAPPVLLRWACTRNLST